MHGGEALKNLVEIVINLIHRVVEHEGLDLGRHIYKGYLASVVLGDAYIELLFRDHVLELHNLFVDEWLVLTDNVGLDSCLLHLFLSLLHFGFVGRLLARKTLLVHAD